MTAHVSSRKRDVLKRLQWCRDRCDDMVEPLLSIEGVESVFHFRSKAMNGIA
jgi:hypothetical protein